MRRRSTAATALCALAVVLAAPHAGAATKKALVAAPKPVVVAVIDTGARATHQEFDYRGPTSTSDQFVGWWDFTSEVKGQVELPDDGESWDTAVADPYDRNGHGTLTASMVGGRGADARKTAAALPGAKLAIAKVGNGDGAIEGDIARAITWATQTVHADVISISIGTIVPIPAALQRADYAAITAARKAGVLVVVANGNGYGNAGVPGDPGWANGYSSSTKALTVGAAGTNGYLVTTDPEVSAVFTVTGPSHTSDNGYVKESGTSFGTPYVAGFAANLLQAARAAGKPLAVDQLEKLIKFSAMDTSTPPMFEGYGVVSDVSLPVARQHAQAGTLPTRPSPDASGTYVESVSGSLRTAWSG